MLERIVFFCVLFDVVLFIFMLFANSAINKLKIQNQLLRDEQEENYKEHVAIVRALGVITIAIVGEEEANKLLKEIQNAKKS